MGVKTLAKKFSIKDIMSEESKSGAVTYFEIINIPIEKIEPSELNKYGIRDIEDLAASIEEMGLLHNLVVKDINNNGLYEIISGERRYKACRLLFDNGNEQFKYLPCKVEKPVSDSITELKLIHANATARVLNDWEKIYQAGRINEIVYKLKEEGYEFTGRMRSVVAEILEVSDAQAGRMIKIDKDLANEVKEELKSGNIGITAAYEISALDKEEQAEILEEIKESGRAEIQAYKNKKKRDLKNIPGNAQKEKETMQKLLERIGISLYNDDGSIRNPAELGQDIFKFLGI
jgi:ParB family chromosome partitioning protein